MGFAPRRNRDREPGAPMKPLVDPAGWTAAELTAQDDWIHVLSPTECDEIFAAVESVEKRGLEIKDIGRADFVLPNLSDSMMVIRDELLNGRGFVLIRGLPVADFTTKQSAIAYWGLSLYFGHVVSQNGKGHLLGHVRDVGGDYGDANTRGYLTSAPATIHFGLPQEGDVTAIVVRWADGVDERFEEIELGRIELRRGSGKALP